MKNFFVNDEVNSKITDALFEVTKQRRENLNEHYGATSMKEIMKGRRDNFINQFRPQDIIKWEEQNFQQAQFLKEDALKRASKYEKDEVKENKEFQPIFKSEKGNFPILNELRSNCCSKFTYASGSREI